MLRSFVPTFGNDSQRNVFAIIYVVNDAGSFVGVTDKFEGILSPANRGKASLIFVEEKAVRQQANFFS